MIVLLIDDDPINNIVNKKLISKHSASIEIFEFQDAEKAVIFLKESPANKPDVILLDINMPKMNGWQFLDIYQNLNINSRLFMLTSSIAREDETRARNYSVVHGFLIKPLNGDKIKQIFS